MKESDNWEERKEKNWLSVLRSNPKIGFEKAYAEYGEKLLYYIYSKTGDKRHSEDMLQDVFVEFWNKIDQVDTTVYGFIFQITKYQIFNYFRSKQIRNKYILHFSNFLSEINSVTPQKYLEAKEIMEQIEQIVEQMPPQCRKVFIMSRFEYKTNEQIAQDLQISKRTVENYITKALAFIRENNISIYLILCIFLDKEKF